MSLLHFLAPQRERISADSLRLAYMAGCDGVPWQSRLTPTSEGFTLARSVDDSGYFYIPWPVEGYGRPTLSTGTLVERDRPYHLPVELARGTLCRIRNQVAQWKAAGMTISDANRQLLDRAIDSMLSAATSQHTPDAAVDAADRAERAIRDCLELIEHLAADYSRPALTKRHRTSPRLPTLFACRLPEEPPEGIVGRQVRAAFNAGEIAPAWAKIEVAAGRYDWSLCDRQVRWCREHGLRVCGGPLVQLDRANVPDWLYLWEDDYEALRSSTLGFVEAAVTRYRGKMHLWTCAAHMNVPDALSLTESQRLRLTVEVIQLVRRVDPAVPIVVGIDQPWAEYLARTPMDLAPLHFADALLRADLGLAGVALEINLGYWPGGTLPRDLLEINHQIDRWSALGIPILVRLTLPSDDAPDPHVRVAAQPIVGGVADEVTPESQRSLAGQLTLLLLSKPAVQGIVWSRFDDGGETGFPHGGLFDQRRHPKPVLEELTAIRREHLL